LAKWKIESHILSQYSELLNEQWLIAIAQFTTESQESLHIDDPNESHFLVENIANYEVSIVIADDETLTQLNRDHLGEDSPTDVLAFPFLVPVIKAGGWGLEPSMSEFANATAISEDDNSYLHMGEVILSYERAIDQARDHNQEFKNEIALLLVHGILHLFGYDHAEIQEQKTMWRLQESIVNELGTRGII
jgi:probable rRNA maturation factor